MNKNQEQKLNANNKMKMFKNSIAGLMLLMATQAMANNADITKDTREQKIQRYTMVSSLHQLEQKLIKDYLNNAFQEEVIIEKEDVIKIFDLDGGLVYQGELSNASDLVEKSSHLFDFDNTGYFLINQ